MTPEDFKIISDLTDRIKRLESKVKTLEGKTKRWQPPTREEVISYCKERKNGVDPNQWYDFYVAKNWMIGKNKMKDWRAAVRTWEKNVEQPVKSNAVPDRTIPIDYGIPSETAITRAEYLKRKNLGKE
jgi:hypothetical protein